MARHLFEFTDKRPERIRRHVAPRDATRRAPTRWKRYGGRHDGSRRGNRRPVFHGRRPSGTRLVRPTYARARPGRIVLAGIILTMFVVDIITSGTLYESR